MTAALRSHARPSGPPPPADAPTTNDADVIEPAGRRVRFAGREVEIFPMVVGRIPKVTRTLNGVAIRGSDAASIMALIADHGDQVIEAAAHAAGLPLADVQAASLPEFVELFAAVVEVNAGFFTEAVTRLAATIGAFGAGLTSSIDSSTPDTSSPT